MNKRFLATTAAAIFAASMAFGQSQADSVVSQLQSQGYSHVEIQIGPDTMKVEAVRDGMKRSFLVDRATGKITMDFTRPLRPGESAAPGVDITNVSGGSFNDHDLGSNDSSNDLGGLGDDSSGHDRRSDTHGSDGGHDSHDSHESDGGHDSGHSDDG